MPGNGRMKRENPERKRGRNHVQLLLPHGFAKESSSEATGKKLYTILRGLSGKKNFSLLSIFLRLHKTFKLIQT